MFFKWVDLAHTRGVATLLYIKGLTEPLTRLLRRHDILVTNKPVITLQQEFPAAKFRLEEEDQCNVVCKIPCSTCSWSYIGKTGHLKTLESCHSAKTVYADNNSRAPNQYRIPLNKH